MSGLRAALPREHGFWTMLLAVQLATLLRVGPSWTSAAAVVGCIALLSVAGGMASRAVRRHTELQIASAAVLGVSGLPLELAVGWPPIDALITAFAWTIVFTASALLVRGVFARARRRGPPAWPFDLGAVGLTGTAALACVLLGALPQAVALAASAMLLLVLARTRPTPRQLRPVGLALAALSALAGTVLVVGAGPIAGRLP